MTKPASRAIDHLVLPVANIDVARSRYESLGFSVAPTGLHPFGTENCCIFLEDGTFLEPLGIAQLETCKAEARKGNTFVANDQLYRFRRGVEGFSHLVIKSDDAKADDDLYKSEGMSGGCGVRFSREFKTAKGEMGEASFSLVFAADRRAPDAHFFACEVIQAPKVDRSALTKHTNGAVCLKEVVMAEPNPSDFQGFLQIFLNQHEVDHNSCGIAFETANGRVSVLSPEGMKALYGLSTEERGRGLLLKAFVLGVNDLSQVRVLIENNGIDYRTIGPKIVVPPQTGQGAAIAFEEVS